MQKRRWQMRQRISLLMAVLALDGMLLGTAAGIIRYGNAGGAASLTHRSMPVFSDNQITGDKVVALTFDDGPHETYTLKLLDGLKKRDVKVTFFLMGQNISGNEDLVLRMQKDGHLIGNHSYRHVQLTKAGEDNVCNAVEQTEKIIENITGSRPKYLRPPYGDWNENLECRLDLTTVFWTVDSLDWKLQNTEQIVSRVEKKVRNGDIILMHDIFPESVEAALEIIDHLKTEGYQFVTVEELLID